MIGWEGYDKPPSTTVLILNDLILQALKMKWFSKSRQHECDILLQYFCVTLFKQSVQKRKKHGFEIQMLLEVITNSAYVFSLWGDRKKKLKQLYNKILSPKFLSFFLFNSSEVLKVCAQWAAHSTCYLEKIKYPISPLLYDKVQAKAFQAFPVVSVLLAPTHWGLLHTTETHTDTHTTYCCAPFIDIMHSLGPYDNPNHHKCMWIINNNHRVLTFNAIEACGILSFGPQKVLLAPTPGPYDYCETNIHIH